MTWSPSKNISKINCYINVNVRRDYKYLSWAWGVDRNSVPRGTAWHHEACRVMSDCDPQGRIFFLSTLHTQDGFLFLHTFHFWKWGFDNSVTSIADAHHIVMTIPWRLVTPLRSVTLTWTVAYRDVVYNQCISNTWKFSIFIFPTGRIRGVWDIFC